MKYIFLTAVLLASSVAVAQDDEARIHFEAGSLHYGEANYENALEEFTRAYELSNRPALLFNMSQCHERLGQLGEAIETLERFIADTDDAEEKARQERRLPNLQRRYAEEQAAAAEPDAEAVTTEVNVESNEERDGPPPPRPEPSHGLRNAGFAVLGVGAAGLLTFAVAGSLALSKHSELEDLCASGVPSCTEDQVAPVRTRMLVADIGLGIGIAAAAAGVIMVILGSGGDDEDTAALAPMIRQDGGGAAMALSF